ncbi:MAG: hypothetical protein RSD40_06055 [Bacilli bacterium]
MINYLEFHTSDKSANELFEPSSAKLDINNREDDNDFVSIYYNKKNIFISSKIDASSTFKSGTTVVIKKIYDDTSKFDYL